MFSSNRWWAWAGLCLMIVVSSSLAVEIIYDRTSPNLGLAEVIPLEQQTWRSKVMICPTPVTDACRIWSGVDFFEGEFARPCTFDHDWIKEEGFAGPGRYTLEDKQLVFTTGPEGFEFGFGGEPGDPTRANRPSLRFGCLWNAQRKDVYRLAMTLEQDVPETTWTFQTIAGGKPRNIKTFKITGQGGQTYETDLGFVRELDGSNTGEGIKFVCATPGATVKIRSIRIAPSSATVYFRKQLYLEQQPIRAHATFQVSEVYDLYVNGRKIDGGSRIYPAGLVKTVDLTPYLKQGRNTIAFGKEFMTWSMRSPAWLFEGMAVDRDGRVTHIPGDDSWKSSLKADGDWWEPGYDDSLWQAPKLEVYAIATGDGARVSNGVEPRHMGMLDVKPAGRKYPVFMDTDEIAFVAEIPVGLKNKAQPELSIYGAGTTTLVETIHAPPAVIEGDFARFTMAVATHKPGPYRLEWRLVDAAGQTLEQRREELVIAGPIPQDVLPLADFEQALEKRLTLVQHIDCAAPAPDDARFLDHSGEYHPAKTNLGKAVERDSLRYRETGPGQYDWFGYRLNLKDMGVPHMVEIVVPDNADRYIYSAVVEQHPIDFPNNSRPLGSRSWVAVTGTCLTGFDYPLTLGERKLRYIYWPGTPAAAVTVMNGTTRNPAAACRINIYRVEGGLPALRVPDSDRRFGVLNERLSVMTLGTACESPLEHDLVLRKNGHRDAWYHWYKQFERKIAWLRHQGHNMTSEGVYMYNNGETPSIRNNLSVANDELDPMNLGLKMYQANGIHCLLGFEFCSTPAIWTGDEDGISDRRMKRDGKPSVHMVDRYGRQVLGVCGSTQNFLDPRVQAGFLDTLGEIHDRYHNAGSVDGLALITGRWWVPGFLTSFYDLENTEVGYDDLTVELFEKETGITLGVHATDPQRFARRYDALMGRHQQAWLRWRCQKVRDFMAKVRQRLAQADPHWPIYLCPQLDLTTASGQPPFKPTDDPRERADYLKRRLQALGFDPDLYRDEPGIYFVPQLPDPTHMDGGEQLEARGVNTDPDTTALLARSAGFFRVSALNEMSFPTDSARQWLWRGTARAAFVARGVEDNGMAEFVDILAPLTPRVILYSWMDCNMDTAFGAQQRRFCKSLYVTPQVRFKPLDAEKTFGLTAQIAPRQDGGTWLRLVNNTPCAVTGVIRADERGIDDLVYDRPLEPAEKQADSTHAYRIDLMPHDIRILIVRGDPASIATHLTFQQAQVSEQTLRQGDQLLKDQKILKHTPAERVNQLRNSIERKDAVALFIAMKDFQLAARVQAGRKIEKARYWQELFLNDLRQTGLARIICADHDDYTDQKGRRWYPDQLYINEEAYGNIGAHFADRGNVPIAGTDAPHVYQTEAYGNLVRYIIPVPNGPYTVRVHIAETYPPIQSANVRLFTMKIQDTPWPGTIDPFTLAGGFARAYVLTQEDVKVTDGLIRLEFKGGVGIGGIEIQSVKLPTPGRN